jgi:hypothetical protein
MEKKIQDYLHLYIGQYAIHYAEFGEQRIYISGFNVQTGMISNIAGEETLKISEVKLILRPLSSMTEEERRELVMQSVLPCEDRDVLEDALRTKYLLSKSFDLFGLIESNLAVEKK